MNPSSKILPLGLLGLCLVVGCGGVPEDRLPTRGTILIRMTDWQEPWFTQRVGTWPKRGPLELDVESYQRIEDLPGILRRRQQPTKGGAFVLCKAEGRLLALLAEEKLITPLDAIVDDRGALEAPFLPEALAPARFGGKLWGLPRKIENHILVYRREAVNRALSQWESFEGPLQEIFRKENGKGLPGGYTLEADPREWDSWDLAVVGYIWSHVPIGGVTEARLGHRSADDAGTFVDLAGRFYAQGGRAEDLLSLKGQALVDFLTWEAFFLRYGIYPPSMIDPGWDVQAPHRAFKEERLLAAPMHQLDAFEFERRHGSSEEGGSPSLGCAPMPQGASLELDESGAPRRLGAHRSHLAGWWWVVPASCPCPRKALELARFITSSDFLGAEAARFGMYPVRRDVWKNLETLFPSPWARQVLETSRSQFSTGCPPVPDDRLKDASRASRLLKLWRRMATHPDLMNRSRPLKALAIADWLNES